MATLEPEEAFGVVLALYILDEAADRQRKRRATLPCVLQRQQQGAIHALAAVRKRKRRKTLPSYVLQRHQQDALAADRKRGKRSGTLPLVLRRHRQGAFHALAADKRKRKATLPYVLQRHQQGAFHALVQELAEQDPKYLRKFLRMSREAFDVLLHTVGPHIQKRDTNFKEAIAPEERLAVTLRFLAEGGSFLSLFNLFHIPLSTLCYVIAETCEAIYNALKDQYLKTPTTEREWLVIQEQFQGRWNFPQCLGAIDGKHVRIKCPRRGGSAYRNDQGFHSIVLFVIVDAQCKFLYHEFGAEGCNADATLWDNSAFKRDLEMGLLNTPPSMTSPRTNVAIPSLVVADATFALSPNLMTPYAEGELHRDIAVFNHRLSRVRRTAENAFGVLTSRFGMYQRMLQQQPPQAKKSVLASLALHNFLCDRNDQQYCGAGYADFELGNGHLVAGEWRQMDGAQLTGLKAAPQNQCVTGGKVRDALKDYFMHEEGQGVPWQNEQYWVV